MNALMAGRGQLAADVYKLMFDATGSFEKSGIGPDLAYLMGAILTGERVTFSPRRAIVRILRDASTRDDAFSSAAVLALAHIDKEES